MTGKMPDLNYHGRTLVRQLKALRERTGMTQTEAGDRAHIEFKKLSRLERVQLLSYHELVILLDVYGVLSCDYEPYLELWKQARIRGWWTAYSLRDVRYVRMEAEADEKLEFQLGLLPSLLQTEDYARAVFDSGNVNSKKTVQNLVEVRMRQQERLFAERPLRLHTLVYEPVLRVGVDREQLLKILNLIKLPNVTVQIVPETDSVIAGSCGSVVVLSFDDPEESDTAFTETVLGLTEKQNADDISTVKRLLKQLKLVALSPQESEKRLREML